MCGPVEFPDELLAGQRAVLVGTWLLMGRCMTTMQIARELGLTRQGASVLMDKLSAVIPVYKDELGYWRWLQG